MGVGVWAWVWVWVWSLYSVCLPRVRLPSVDRDVENGFGNGPPSKLPVTRLPLQRLHASSSSTLPFTCSWILLTGWKGCAVERHSLVSALQLSSALSTGSSLGGPFPNPFSSPRSALGKRTLGRQTEYSDHCSVRLPAKLCDYAIDRGGGVVTVAHPDSDNWVLINASPTPNCVIIELSLIHI